LGGEHKKGVIITEFEFNEYAYEYESLKVLKFDEYNEQWFDFIVFNRSKLNSTPDFGTIIY
ncbi:MAG: DUF3990 domain-containing protein, partial [Marinilabiliaceae bacterium]|nr:DUF3990 domain-containing protein [Marinilabiliaceae bacterium]